MSPPDHTSVSSNLLTADAARNQSAATTGNSIPTEALGRGQWLLVSGALIAMAAIVNWILPIPDINDFKGLAQNCLLMERRGLHYCVNSNWGFAHPLMNYLMTRVTGDLLVSQRILSFIGAAACLVCAERVMRRLFAVRPPVRVAFLLAAVVSPWMAEGLVSVHLDILPIALCLAAVSMLGAEGLASYFAAGLLISAGSWFRFHFAEYAILFIALVAAHSWQRKATVRAAMTALGVAAGFAVPVVLSEWAFGVPSMSNQKLILAMLQDSFSLSVQYQSTLSGLTLSTILSNIQWLRLTVWRGFTVLEWTPFILLISLFAIHFFHSLKRPSTADSTTGVRARMLRLVPPVIRKPTVLYMIFVLLAVAPFLVIRERTLRLEAAVFLIGFPWLAAVYSLRLNPFDRGLVLAILVAALAETPGVLFDFRGRTRAYQQMEREVATVIPASVAANAPDKVMDALSYFPNRYNRYWLWNPAVTGGWPAGFAPFRREFGVVDLSAIRTTSDFHNVEFVLLARKPRFVFERYDENLLKTASRSVEFKDLVVLELPTL